MCTTHYADFSGQSNHKPHQRQATNTILNPAPQVAAPISDTSQGACVQTRKASQKKKQKAPSIVSNTSTMGTSQSPTTKIHPCLCVVSQLQKYPDPLPCPHIIDYSHDS
ncbi:hypothetical protein VTJ04DRAFT_9240 [Mycothermus thermophilus]|uniref:uncharacterized protein n=1 Tax=Humicola insolens TaxID=85995 RepID=UPI003742161A